MPDPQPVAQQVASQNNASNTTNSDQPPSADAWWKNIAPQPMWTIIENLGVDRFLESPPLDFLGTLGLDAVADVIERLREAKDELAGPDQISFSLKTKAPLNTNLRNNAHKHSLRYPADIKAEETDYMMFQFFRYEAPFGRGGVGTYNLLRQTAAQGSGEYGTLEEYNLSSTNLAVDTQLSQVILYIPPDVSSTYGASWNDKSFSNTAVAKIRGGMALRRGNPAAAVQGQFENLINAVGRMPEIKGADFIRNEIAKATGESLSRNDLFASAAGVVTNPNTELLYDSPQMRGIDFTFKLVPNNKTEAEIIFEIVRTFKKCLHPSFGVPGREQGGKPQGVGSAANAAGNANSKVGFITVPSVCKFAFMKGGGLHPFLPQYKTCALIGVDVNYTADNGYAVTRDGYPVATELRLQFKELKLVYREDIGAVDAGTLKFGNNKLLHGGH